MSIGSASEIITLTHQGKGYSVSTEFEMLAAAVTAFVGYPDALHAHFHDMALDASAGPVLIEFIESPTVTSPGTQVAPMNRRRDSDNAARMRVFGGATVTGGTLLFESVMYGAATGVNRGADQGLIRGEWNLHPEKAYAIRITNQTGTTISVSADMHFYEDVI